MDKKLNTLFFGSCFLAALLGEAYSLLILKETISIIAMGIVVIITGYLLMDSIRTKAERGIEKLKFLADKIHQEEVEKWSDRYTELLNIHKATYGAIKKNNIQLNHQIETLQVKLTELESNNAKALQLIGDLQLKSLEGQKQALNIEVNHNKENTKQLINHNIENTKHIINHNNDNMKQLFNVIQEEGNKIDNSQKLDQVIALLDKLNKAMDRIPGQVQTALNQQEDKRLDDFTANTVGKKIENIKVDEYDIERVIKKDIIAKDVIAKDVIAEDVIIEEPVIVPLYEDANKKLTPEEIAALFASVSNN